MARQQITVTVADRGQSIRVAGWINGTNYGLAGSPLDPTGLDDEGQRVSLSTSAQLRAYEQVEAAAEHPQ